MILRLIVLLLLCYSHTWAGFGMQMQTGGGVSVTSGVTELTMQDSTSASVATGSSITIDVPTNSDGDLLTLSVVNDDGGSITTPDGWTSQGSQASGETCISHTPQKGLTASSM